MSYISKLDALFEAMQKLTPESSSEDFNKFSAFFDENCTVYLKSMREHDAPNLGRQAVINAMKENLTVQQLRLDERRVLSTATTADGLTVVCEMKNRIKVFGEVIDPFYETDVAVFNPNTGLITTFRQYCCWSHIVRMVQDKTGVGPYVK